MKRKKSLRIYIPDNVSEKHYICTSIYSAFKAYKKLKHITKYKVYCHPSMTYKSYNRQVCSIRTGFVFNRGIVDLFLLYYKICNTAGHLKKEHN